QTEGAVGGCSGVLLGVILSATREAGRPQTILVVDADPDIREAVRGILERSIRGTRVLTAASGQEGLGILARETVDLIVTDYKMPGMNGLEFLDSARLIDPQAPRILITAFEHELMEQSNRDQAARVFTK